MIALPGDAGRPRKVYVIHENAEWMVPLRDAFAAREVPFEEWFLDTGTLDLSKPPPEGVFYNRMSASSHTRGHRFGPEFASLVLTWLESHGRRVVNGRHALALEVSKVEQYAGLRQAGVRVPHTVAAIGADAILKAAEGFEGPFITKHNRAGKGLGVRLFHDRSALATYVQADDFEVPIDGVTLLQQYIDAPDKRITRAEFVGGRFLYAVRVDTSQGFELCPADACQIDDIACPVGTSGAGETPRFVIDAGPRPTDVAKYEQFLKKNGIEVAGIEFIADREGTTYTYDVNTNTNYNADAEAAFGKNSAGSGAEATGMGAIAAFLGGLLKETR